MVIYIQLCIFINKSNKWRYGYERVFGKVDGSKFGQFQRAETVL